MPNKEIQYVRNQKYGTLSIGMNGWTKEVCNVTWNSKAPKLDIREWDSDYTKMSKGMTFTKEEAKKLLRILASIDFEAFDIVSKGNRKTGCRERKEIRTETEIKETDVTKAETTKAETIEAEAANTEEEKTSISSFLTLPVVQTAENLF